MSDCCRKPVPESGDVGSKCPDCGADGQPVLTNTLKHMVNAEFLDVVTKPGFHFCRSPHCDVVYFHRDGERLTKGDVRVRVGLKETDDPVPICYCFGFTAAMAREEIELAGKCTISEKIAVEMKAKRCACEVRNPQGSCCLRNVNALIRRQMEAVIAARSPYPQLS